MIFYPTNTGYYIIIDMSIKCATCETKVVCSVVDIHIGFHNRLRRLEGCKYGIRVMNGQGDCPYYGYEGLPINRFELFPVCESCESFARLQGLDITVDDYHNVSQLHKRGAIVDRIEDFKWCVELGRKTVELKDKTSRLQKAQLKIDELEAKLKEVSDKLQNKTILELKNQQTGLKLKTELQDCENEMSARGIEIDNYKSELKISRDKIEELSNELQNKNITNKRLIILILVLILWIL